MPTHLPFSVLRLAVFTVLLLTAAAAQAQPGATQGESNADLAKKLSNPVSELVSLPFEFNYDCCYGSRDASRTALNIQPVMPFAINTDWNLIVRTIVPVIQQGAAEAGTGDHFGLGDTTQSFFLSPGAGLGGWLAVSGRRALAWRAAQSRALCQPAAQHRVVGRDHRIVSRQAPPVRILVQ